MISINGIFIFIFVFVFVLTQRFRCGRRLGSNCFLPEDGGGIFIFTVQPFGLPSQEPIMPQFFLNGHVTPLPLHSGRGAVAIKKSPIFT
jgi:hypothetical protein